MQMTIVKYEAIITSVFLFLFVCLFLFLVCLFLVDKGWEKATTIKVYGSKWMALCQ